MKNYSIVRIGNEYIVQVYDKSILKIASRRMAAKLINDAAELLDRQTPRAGRPSSIASDRSAVPDPSKVP